MQSIMSEKEKDSWSFHAFLIRPKTRKCMENYKQLSQAQRYRIGILPGKECSCWMYQDQPCAVSWGATQAIAKKRRSNFQQIKYRRSSILLTISYLKSNLYISTNWAIHLLLLSCAEIFMSSSRNIHVIKTLYADANLNMHRGSTRCRIYAKK